MGAEGREGSRRPGGTGAWQDPRRSVRALSRSGPANYNGARPPACDQGRIAMPRRIILLALDSVGIDPLGHQRPESVYARSRFLFPTDRSGDVLPILRAPVRGALVETDVVGGHERGAIEC